MSREVIAHLMNEKRDLEDNVKYLETQLDAANARVAEQRKIIKKLATSREHLRVVVDTFTAYDGDENETWKAYDNHVRPWDHEPYKGVSND